MADEAELQLIHIRAERNAKRILSECCKRELHGAPPSDRWVVETTLRSVQEAFAEAIRMKP